MATRFTWPFLASTSMDRIATCSVSLAVVAIILTTLQLWPHKPFPQNAVPLGRLTLVSGWPLTGQVNHVYADATGKLDWKNMATSPTKHQKVNILLSFFLAILATTSLGYFLMPAFPRLSLLNLLLLTTAIAMTITLFEADASRLGESKIIVGGSVLDTMKAPRPLILNVLGFIVVSLAFHGTLALIASSFKYLRMKTR